jgi:lambda repressor-like predicted transcriptional regulator
MIARCTNPKNIGFHLYGGRGISICARWRDSFGNFLADMGPRPKGKTLDRIDCNGDYEPTNCRWATTREQCRNYSRNRIVNYAGRDWVMADLAAHLGVPPMTLKSRLDARWPSSRWGEQTAPRIVYRGEGMSLNELSRRLGIRACTLRGRIIGGWPEENWADPPNRSASRIASNARRRSAV